MESQRLRRWVAAPLAAVTLAVIGLGVTASPLFSVRHVVVTGNAHLSAARLIEESGLDRPANVYWLHARQAEQLVESDPWIASATITRVLPHTIRIHVVERHPASRVQVGSAWVLVAADGTVLGATRRTHPLPILPATSTLTLGRATGDLADAADVAGRMGPWLRSKVATILPQHGGDFVLELASGGRVLLGSSTDLGAKERALGGIVRWAGQHHHRIDYVDLRAPLAPAVRLLGAATG